MERGIEKPPWWAVVVIVVGLVWLVVALPLAYSRDGEPLSKAELDRIDAVASAAYASDTPATPAPVTSVTIPAEPQLFVFGDSYTVGNGATSERTTFAHAAADDLGWPVETNGAGSTGFLNPGPTGTYAERLAQLPVRTTPNVIVIEGGLNDVNQTGDEVAAAREVIGGFRTRFPDAVLVLLGPVDPNPPDSSAAVRRVSGLLAHAAALEQIPLIDATGWLTVDNIDQYGKGDGLHPNQAGHDYIGQNLADAIRSLQA